MIPFDAIANLAYQPGHAQYWCCLSSESTWPYQTCHIYWLSSLTALPLPNPTMLRLIKFKAWPSLNSNWAPKTSSLVITFTSSLCLTMKALLLQKSLTSPYWINNLGSQQFKMPIFGVMNSNSLTSLACKKVCKIGCSIPYGHLPLSYTCAQGFAQFLWDMWHTLLAMASTMVLLIGLLLSLSQNKVQHNYNLCIIIITKNMANNKNT